ncbi:MAG: hypothetical protein Q7V31_15970 [Parvibaculum sp.]|uniref:hypothetical protein n=1 Tax=Parvibaculum sp. TaxID=2024848 RepID=UPI00271DDFE2|nr:hypothetical protein [Parvibaculum sp.]MDO8840410.1 hypothetical protein [Parvibaculum sp.]
MTRFTKLLLAGTASVALMASPVLAAGVGVGAGVGAEIGTPAGGISAGAKGGASGSGAAGLPNAADKAHDVMDTGRTTASDAVGTAGQASGGTTLGSDRSALPRELAVEHLTRLQALGYSDIEPVEAQGDAAAEGQANVTATNPDGARVNLLVDTATGIVIGEEPAE